MRGVDHDALGPGSLTGQRREDAVEHAKTAPANETVIGRFVWPVAVRMDCDDEMNVNRHRGSTPIGTISL